MSDVKIFHGQLGFLGTRLQVFLYLVDGLLIDSGPSRLQKSIAVFCEQHKPELIVHTHFHEDHTGNTAFLCRQHGIPAYIHKSALEICRQKARLPLYRRLFWGSRPAFEPQPLGETISGRTIDWEVIPTPGHSHDHVVLLDKQHGRLFSGDLYLHHKTRVVMRPENMPRLMRSLRHLLSKDFDTIYCAHAGVVKNAHRLIQQKLAHLEELQEQVRQLSARGLNIKQINRKLFPQTPTITYVSSGEWSSLHIVRSLLEDRAE
ncbi:MBL fold metallo-hydrolase [Desulfurispora thermophila]|uniref:MBL fold metallo-hydrolase n=1 Tax=Desulfurispora thermophila TaxID=265470 RepID=UPI00035F2AED|nr:MBL fold metallo-hydrolase [Desulfurispora thermophila]